MATKLTGQLIFHLSKPYLPLEINSKVNLKLNQQLIGEFEIHPEQVDTGLSVTPNVDTQTISDKYPIIKDLNIVKLTSKHDQT